MTQRRIIPEIRRCLIGTTVVVALAEVLLGMVLTGGFRHGSFTIWLVPPILLVMIAEQVLCSNNTCIDRIWTAFSVVAAIHVVLAMILHINHEHDDAVLCGACGMSTLAWYVIPWIVLSMLRLQPPDKKWGIICGWLTLLLIGFACLMRGVISPLLVLDGATYGFLVWAFVKLGCVCIRLIKNPFD